MKPSGRSRETPALIQLCFWLMWLFQTECVPLKPLGRILLWWSRSLRGVLNHQRLDAWFKKHVSSLFLCIIFQRIDALYWLIDIYSYIFILYIHDWWKEQWCIIHICRDHFYAMEYCATKFKIVKKNAWLGSSEDQNSDCLTIRNNQVYNRPWGIRGPKWKPSLQSLLHNGII